MYVSSPYFLLTLPKVKIASKQWMWIQIQGCLSKSLLHFLQLPVASMISSVKQKWGKLVKSGPCSMAEHLLSKIWVVISRVRVGMSGSGNPSIESHLSLVLGWLMCVSSVYPQGRAWWSVWFSCNDSLQSQDASSLSEFEIHTNLLFNQPKLSQML